MATTRTKKHGSSVKDSPASMFQLVPYSRIHYTSNIAANAHVNASTKRIVAPCKAENELAHGWLEAMRNLSPPRMRRIQSNPFDDKSDSDVADMQYRAWMVRTLWKLLLLFILCFTQIVLKGDFYFAYNGYIFTGRPPICS